MSVTASAPVEELVSRNPATGAELGRVPTTDPAKVAELTAKARAAQKLWASRPWRERREVVARWLKRIAKDADSWAELIRDEVGKPIQEAQTEVIATLDAIKWTVGNAGKVLADRKVRAGSQKLMLIPSATLSQRPYGVIGKLGTWNYPLFLNAPAIAQAISAGNAVVWKPSEFAVLVGKRIQDSLRDASAPEGLVATLFGGPDVGQALLKSKIDKGMFTGGVEGGRFVVATLAARGIPSLAELSGFDAAIVLPESPKEATVKALLWGAFVGAGQTCVSVKRVYVVGDSRPWAEAFGAGARSLRVGDPASLKIDIGPMISEAARDKFDKSVQAAVAAGARLLAGGTKIDGPGWYYAPAVLEADTREPEVKLQGCFGPVLLVRGVKSVEEAAAAANDGPFGLGASVWGPDLRLASEIASKLDVGMASVNEAVTCSAHAGAPFGGNKASGFGRTHGAEGLLEFVRPTTLHVKRPGGYRPQLFPYSSKLLKVLRFYRRLVHG